MSKKIERRDVTVYYCDICGKECGLPYHGYDSIGFGSCCSSLMSKLEKADVLKELRVKVPFFGKFFKEYDEAESAFRFFRSLNSKSL
jgi:hypothetical protein